MSKLFTPEEFKNLDPIKIKDLLEEEISFIVSNSYDLGEGFEWCYFRETIIKRSRVEDELIDLTTLEKNLVKLLVESKGDILAANQIIDSVWKDKRASIFTLRNFIRQIREKTFYHIIKTKSNEGYRVKKS